MALRGDEPEEQVNIVEFRAGRLEIATFAERPELRAGVFEAEIQSAVPEFMRHDPTAALYYDDGNLDRYRDYGLVAVDPAERDRPVARAFSVPFALPDPARGREALPYGGWDQVIRWAHRDRLQGVPPTAISALEIMVAPRLQGRGISRVMLTALPDNARRLGFTALYAPIRPTEKHREPLTPFAEYVARRRADGHPHDPWVRTHLRLGATVVKVAPCSMVITGTLAEWREWTGLPFERSGIAVVPGALSPIHVSLEHDHAVYVEPNLWVRHPLG
jgi:GNAT superfamily N-acetyltransferase